MAKILIIEDDEQTSAIVGQWLTDVEHHTVEIIADGQQAVVAMKLHRYDLIVLDWQLPGSSGPEICRKFRQQGGHTPILMVTAKSTIADKELGFEDGVDDYLTKPFHLKELSVRVKALLRRPDVFVSELRAGNLALHVESFRVHKDGLEIKLMPKEFALLEFLIRNKGKIFTAQELLDRVWDSQPDSGTEALRQCMKRLREKIDSDGQPSLITNVPHKGYTIRSES